MNKFSLIGLWDVYSGLLTPTQQEITNLYFNLDLTVSEIAKEKGISRQAVSECLKGCAQTLEEYESKLHIFERLKNAGIENSMKIASAEKWADKFCSDHAEYAKEIEELKKILKGG